MRHIQGVDYYTFGGFPWSYATDRRGNAVHRQEFQVLDENGAEVLDLRDAEGYRRGRVTSDDTGAVPTFLAPVRLVEYRWTARNGQEVRWREWCRETTETLWKAESSLAAAEEANTLATTRGDLVLYNTFNGPVGEEITHTNSGGNGMGDAFGWYSGPGAQWSDDNPMSGSACMKLESIGGSQPGVDWWGFSLNDFTCVLYLRRPIWTFEGNVWWEPVNDALVISDGFGLHWQGPGITIPNCLPPDRWVRIEARRQGSTCTLSVWSDNHLRRGTPDHTASGTGSSATMSDWWLEHEGDPLFYDDWRIFNRADVSTDDLDEFPRFALDNALSAISDGERATERAKSFRDLIPPSQRGKVNRCNGPDGSPVTYESSALYGDRFDFISGAITYTSDAHSGDGAMSFPDTGGLPFVRWDFEANVETATYDVVIKVPASPTNWGSVQFTQGGRALIDPNEILAGTLGGIYLQNLSNTGGVQVIPPEDVPIDSWFRVRLDITADDVRCRVWFDPAGTVPDGDETVSQHSSFSAVTDAAVVLIGLLCDDLVCIPGKPNLIARLTPPVYIAHRGAALLAPENSLEALELCRARGVDLVEIDVHRTLDGGLVLMHNDTIDANTPESGDPSSYSTASIERLRLDPGTWFARVASPDTSTWRNDLRVPTLDDVFAEFGEDLLFLVEVKASAGEPTGQMVVDEVLRAGVENRVIIGSFTRDQLDPALAAKIPVCYFVSNASGDHAQMVSDGIEYLGFNHAVASGGTVDTAIAAGLKCIPYTVNRHYSRDALQAAHPNLWGYTTDDPWYMHPLYDHVIRNAPIFRSRTYHDGQVALLPNEPWTHNPRGEFRSGDGFGIWLDTTVDATSPNNGYLSVSLGVLSQTVGTLPTSYDITFYMENIDGAATGNHGHLVFCATSDLEFDDNPHNVDCYVAMLRRNNTANIYRQDAGPGTATLLGANTDFTVKDAWLRVQVRPTTIALVRTDGENGAALTTLQVTDSTYRGPYVSIGVRDATVRFSKLTLRPL